MANKLKSKDASLKEKKEVKKKVESKPTVVKKLF